jgi:ubiquitin carboxyl-terminal hydrolase 8
MKLRALDDLPPSSVQENPAVGNLNPLVNGVHTTPTTLNHTLSHPTPSQSSGSDKSLRIPRKRPLPLSTPQTAAILNDIPQRPSSASNSEFSSTRSSETSTQLPIDARRFEDIEDMPVKHQIVFPKANVIEPKLLLSYLSKPTTSRPPILLLDVRPKEQYERGCIDAEYVVWIDPILLDEE